MEYSSLLTPANRNGGFCLVLLSQFRRILADLAVAGLLYRILTMPLSSITNLLVSANPSPTLESLDFIQTVLLPQSTEVIDEQGLYN